MMYKKIALIGSLSALTACTSLPTRVMAPHEDPVVQGATVRRNFTPLEPAFHCVANALREQHRPVISIAVGDVKDYTGKYSQNEGNAITQGGALMAYSALGKLGDVVQMHERFDTRIAELELAYTDRRQLGDGQSHSVEPGKPPVSWIPYFGGSILRSQYYIIGGITEVNYDISSGGYDIAVDNVGPRHRTYTMNIGVDLRLVDTRSLVVLKTVSLQKQIKGEEVGVGIYRFFGSDLLDLNVGSKQQEPLQLGVRTTIEQGVLELVGAVGQVDADACIANAYHPHASGAESKKVEVPSKTGAKPAKNEHPAAQPVAAKAAVPATPPVPVQPTPASSAAAGAQATPVAAQPANGSAAQATPIPENGGAAVQGPAYDIEFDVASTAISSRMASVIDQVAKEAAQGRTVNINLLARDSELFPPMRRDELIDQRVRAVSSSLGWLGIPSSRVKVTWRPAPTDSSSTRYGNGLQLLARLAVSQ